MPIICRIIGFEPGAFFFDLRPDGSAIIQRILLCKAEEMWNNTAGKELHHKAWNQGMRGKYPIKDKMKWGADKRCKGNRP